MSVVDCAYYSFTKRCPDFIEAAGSSAIQEWRKDLYSIMLLLRKHADDGPATAPRLMVEAQAAFIRENISPQKVLIKDIISYIPRGKWPRQISSGTERSLRERGAQAMLESHFVSLITNISGDDFMEAQGQSSFDSKKYYETGDLELMLVELYQGFIEDGLRRLDDWKRNEPNIQNAGPCLHNIWRLPHWAFLRISGIMQVDYFIDLRSQRVVHKKPPLYCGGDDETRVSGLKGKGEDAAIDHWSSKHSYIDLTIYPSTAQDAANSKINISCCWVDMRGDLGSMSRDHDDTLAKMIVESLGEIFRATIESRKMENFKAMMDLVGHIMFWDAEGLTPLRRAAVHNQYDMVRVIIDRSRQLGRLWFRSPLVLQTMIEERNSAMTDILLEAGADPNGIVPDGIPPLHFCLSQHDAPEIVGVLIRKGADIRVRSPEGTPLEIATSCDRQLSLEVLKEAMENTGIDNSHGNTLSQHPVQTSETSTTLAISESRCCESASPDTAIISHDSLELSTERTTHESSPDHSLNG